MSEDDGMCFLKCNNFGKIFGSQYKSLQETKTLTDLTIVCEGRRLEAHKLVLMASSSYFRDLIDADLTSKPHLVFFFNEIPFSIMKSVLDYIYTGEVQIPNVLIKSFIEVAEKLSIRGLIREAPEVPKPEKRPRIEETVNEEEERPVLVAKIETSQEEVPNIEIEYEEVHEEQPPAPSLKSDAEQWISDPGDSNLERGGPKSAPSAVPTDEESQGSISGKRLSSCMVPTNCNICGRTYSNASNLKQHMRLIHNPAPVICQICKKHYSSNLYLKRHFNAVHGPSGSQQEAQWEMFDSTKQGGMGTG